jgi:hypothetical protein
MTQLVPIDQLLQDIRGLIEDARSKVAVVVNVGLTMLHWQIGRRVRQELFNEERANS